MNEVPAQHAGPAVLASDAEREHAVALLRRGFADGRLNQAELEERAGAAYAARTRAQLGDLTADLPVAGHQPPRPGMIPDRRTLCILLCACPPAGAAYWLLAIQVMQRGMSGQQALAVVSHLAGAVLVSAGVIIALPAISRSLHRAWVTLRGSQRR